MWCMTIALRLKPSCKEMKKEKHQGKMRVCLVKDHYKIQERAREREKRETEGERERDTSCN